jgi:phosphoglycolate phosphatase
MIILFDLDGTLIDSTKAILESFYASFKVFNFPIPSDEKIKSFIGLPLDIMFVKLGVDETKKWEFVEAYKKHYRPISKQKTTLLPFAKEAIIKASKIATLGIVTTKTSLYSKELMEHFGVMKYFDVLIGRDDVENPKPHPEPIFKALEKLDTKDKKIYMIGDTCLDCISAKEAKINSIGVHSGYGDRKDLKNCCEIVKVNALEAVKFLSKEK